MFSVISDKHRTSSLRTFSACSQLPSNGIYANVVADNAELLEGAGGKTTQRKWMESTTAQYAFPHGISPPATLRQMTVSSSELSKFGTTLTGTVYLSHGHPLAGLQAMCEVIAVT